MQLITIMFVKNLIKLLTKQFSKEYNKFWEEVHGPHGSPENGFLAINKAKWFCRRWNVSATILQVTLPSEQCMRPWYALTKNWFQCEMFNRELCHSSAFQTIAVWPNYIKIINYSGCTLAHLHNTIQTKKYATKIHTHSKYNKVH